MEFIDYIYQVIEKESPFLSSGIDINGFIAECPSSMFYPITLRVIERTCNELFDKTYLEWKTSGEPDIAKFFTKRADEIKKRGDAQHAKLLMVLLENRLLDDFYLFDLEKESLRNAMIEFCDNMETSMTYQIYWPQNKQSIQEILEDFGWKKMNCSRNKNPMTRTRKPRALKRRRKMNAVYYFNSLYNVWATITDCDVYFDK